MKFPIYLDNSSTTMIDPRVLEKMLPYMTNKYGNYSSRSHSFGWESEDAVEAARLEVANTLNCDVKEIIWTSGATESNNLAIKGAAEFYKQNGNHLITVKTEHKAVLDSMRQLEHIGYKVTYLDVLANGLIDLEEFEKAITKDTILASVMLVNNEIGVIQDIGSIAEICDKHNVLLHVDAAQAVGKMRVDVQKLNVALMSFSAHKVYGPKGIGALYVRRKPRVRLLAQMHGGGHERGFRSGTLPTHQIVGMGEAFRIANEDFDSDIKHIKKLHNKFLNGIKSMEEVYVNGDLVHRVPHNINVSFNYIEGESLLMSIKGVAVSSGSACTSSSLESSYVLKALGVNSELAHSSIRFTFSRFNMEEEVDYVISLLTSKVNKLRAMSPLWEMYKNGIDVANYKWNSDGKERDIIIHR